MLFSSVMLVQIEAV